MNAKILCQLLIMLCLFSYSYSQNTGLRTENPQDVHRDPTHNFTMQRLIVINDKKEMLMVREEYVWATPAAMYNERMFVKESLDSIAKSYGITISGPKLRGHFGYKYDYHPFSSLRSYYIAKYVSGKLSLPSGMDEVKWVPIPEAIEMNSVDSIKEILGHIFKNPETLWGGSFMVYRNDKGHPTEKLEDFYPLFE